MASADAELDRKIVEAHEAGDTAALAALYGEAAADAEGRGLIDQACFLYTQAYVFALDAGLDTLAGEHKAHLVAHGRES